MSLHSEILEQPQKLADLLKNQRHTVEEVARAVKQRHVNYVMLAARGTSDNAGRYANYLLGSFNQLAVALATPSLFTYYQTPPQFNNALVIGISQSGQSPDIVSVLAEGKKQGCLTLAITNIPGSPITQVADFVLDINAGPELATAATKTYSAELMVLAMLSAALSEDETRWQELDRVAAWTSEAIKLDESLAQAAQRYRYMNHCVVLGRGFNYSTAFEWALKMKELTYVEAEPYSSADFMHGPIAMVQMGFPVLAVAPAGKVFDSMLETLQQLKNELNAELVVISNEASALSLAQVPIRIPAEVPEWLTPLVGIIPAQLFAYHLTQVKGNDTEAPRVIHKVTETR
ncbi:MAG: SIS domain-containing protein [Anaerolineaceae bacterium]|nr:SIS domain-containing protein [Anaerolineaceae bacterium]